MLAGFVEVVVRAYTFVVSGCADGPVCFFILFFYFV